MSTTAVPYQVSCPDSGVVSNVLLTVLDAPDGSYRFAGIPDGLGAFAVNERYFDLVCTHEIFYNEGGARRHAKSGSFVSRWRIDCSEWDNGNGELRVVKGWDQIGSVHYWRHSRNTPTNDPDKIYGSDKNVPLERLCSADLPPVSALYFEEGDTKYGTRERVFLGGEETHTKYKLGFGRAWAHILTGSAPEKSGQPFDGHTYELPRMGRLSFENVVCCPRSQQETIAVCLDDSTADTGREFLIRKPPSELYVYVGTKTESSKLKDPALAELDKAGLLNGELFGVKVEVDGAAVPWENEEFGFGTKSEVHKAKFRLHSLGDRSKDSPADNPGVALQKDSITNGITQFLRIEDGSWDPRSDHQHEFYFVTTHKFDGNSRLFRLSFDDIANPTAGGTIEILLNAKSGADHRYQMLDSITVDPWGRVFIQEDTGGESYITRTMMYLPETGKLYEVARGNERVFRDQSSPLFLTVDEESAGIIPVFDILGDGWFLTAVQAHNPISDWVDRVSSVTLEPEVARQLADDLVEPGQVLAMYIPKNVERDLAEVDPS